LPQHSPRRSERYDMEKWLGKRRREGKVNTEPDRGRRKNWLPEELESFDEFEEIDSLRYERLMSRKERARRRATTPAALAELKEEEERFEELVREPAPAEQQGTVIEVCSGGYRVQLGAQNLVCEASGSLQMPETSSESLVAIGDEVRLTTLDAGKATIKAILPRRSLVVWPGVSPDFFQQLAIANATQILIVVSWREPDIQFDLLDRYLIAAAQNDLTPVICVNKIDLTADKAAYQAALKPYQDLGYHLIFASAHTGGGLDEVRKVLRGKTTILVGPAHAGKSTLLEAIEPEAKQLNGSEENHHQPLPAVYLQALDMGGAVVDIAANGNLVLRGLRQKELAGYYPEMAAIVHKCRFDDCSHTHEPGCAVKTAVQQNRISNRRYHNYKKIYASLPT
jgi:ribosome biogenesis GTPase / thiamine phosphate phosphatase